MSEAKQTKDRLLRNTSQRQKTRIKDKEKKLKEKSKKG